MLSSRFPTRELLLQSSLDVLCIARVPMRWTSFCLESYQPNASSIANRQSIRKGSRIPRLQFQRNQARLTLCWMRKWSRKVLLHSQLVRKVLAFQRWKGKHRVGTCPLRSSAVSCLHTCNLLVCDEDQCAVQGEVPRWKLRQTRCKALHKSCRPTATSLWVELPVARRMWSPKMRQSSCCLWQFNRRCQTVCFL